MMVKLDDVKDCLRSYGKRFWENETMEMVIQDLEEQLGRRGVIHRADDGERPKG